ncbi:hypothetical protein NKI54_33300 [Mesorhizobium sp. M0663]|uniref:ATP-binding protein n=1 Tax=unclassified Mesorhizobium TaxID=325217 RepID=UPI00333ABFE7
MTALGVSTLSKARPFPGLRPFGPLDQKFFFGRSAQFFALYRLLDLSRFVAVIGNSGSGKSSLVRAGLLPLLDEENREGGGRQWLWIEMRPGDLPLESLIQTLKHLGDDLSATDDPIINAMRAERISHHLRGSSHGIAKAIGEMDGVDKKIVVLVIDQFEELFRFASSASMAGIAPREEARLRDEAAQFVQLLLEASRSPVALVRVLLTMRSDFIGDCARFQGLPEAVSATQFLVPSLTRDQREEVIKGPIALAEATIDSSLVEQLLNDSGVEQDQLPVLQHCLLRLWERARPTETATAAAGDTRQTTRHISRREYDEIGLMAGALSQHAEEILATDLNSLEPLVARVFRALSDIDRDGRATRRVLSLQQLGAETAINEDGLRTIVDRFRADDCSFLTPSPAATPTLDPRTRIDVGHEALLRHWERVSGEPGATGERTDDRRIGWLRDEYRDGQRYQALRAIASGDDTETPLLPLDQVTRYWTWWNERPRTEAWASRYGGGHARVERMLHDSRDALDKQHQQRLAEIQTQRMASRTRIAAGVMGALLILAVISGGLIYRRNQIAHEVETFEFMSNTLRDNIDSVLERQRQGTITVAAAQERLASIDEALGRFPDMVPVIMALKANVLLSLSDALKIYGETAEALERVLKAKELAQKLTAIDPKNMDWLRLDYSSSFRIGDATLSLRTLPSPNEMKVAVEQYSAALTIAEVLYAAEPERADRVFDLAFIHNKLGEAMQIQKDYPGSLAQFGAALEIAKKAAEANVSNITLQSYVAATMVKIANTLQWQTPQDLDGALANYVTALSIYEGLRAQALTNDVVLSNLASAHRGRADLLLERWESGDFKKAVADYSETIAIFSALAEKDPTNVIWRLRLAPAYSRLGKAFEKSADVAGALGQYKKELEIREWLLSKDSDNLERQKNLAATLEKIAKLEGSQAGQSLGQP